ncbi:DUF2165 domain-containing protein [Amycolatopsis anabasis]|uniref:DUF2165 domain-containing protein n=1 Tax=Amycolatopsis anabasis TaxID=1840409 RepID=UPI00131AFB4D|nr:DUF2165 domain-containing protein [Amycolatopsis anabasis]
MRLLARIGGLGVVVAVLTAVSALHLGLIAFNNLTDFGTNQAFVHHVLAMDTTFRSPNLMWRAITSPGLADAAYIAIIAWEVLTALVLFAAVGAWLGGRPRARQLSTLGWLMMALLFGLGFLVIGGEWFAMWQSQEWNGLQPALQNFLLAAVGLVLAQLRPAKAS